MRGAAGTMGTPPLGYPAEYECETVLADGRKVSIRPIVPSDAAELAEAIRTADPATRYARFLGGPPPITPAVLDSLTRLDYRTRFALVAFSDGRGVAVARYAQVPSSAADTVEAEIAIAVAPDFRRVGLATALIQLLGRRAQECGITDFTALFFAQNRPVMKLAQLSEAKVAIAEGLAELQAVIPTLTDD